MISICIPVYNFPIVKLVESLSEQAITEKVEYEILVIDDASDEYYKKQNRVACRIPGVIYTELHENVGRSKIRNILAEESKFDNLIFIDCDAEVTPGFLKNYLMNIVPQTVIVGGVSYSNQKPSAEYMLRWRYGKKRESTNAEIRSKNPYNSFKTFNFLIPKEIFVKIKFDEGIRDYGHEDTLFGIELKKKSIPIKHIENPLVHLGLETNEIFIKKTKNGIENLCKILNSKNSTDFIEGVSLLCFYFRLPKFLRKTIAIKFRLLEPVLYCLLRNALGPMTIFDFYKLGYLCKINNR